jgi:predicted TIM-barrel fold metal-dependent hydrolase
MIDEGIDEPKKGIDELPSKPRLPSPPGACDSHMHIAGPLSAYPYRETRSLNPPEALWADYKAMSSVLGLERCVIVQPSFYATDNDCTLDSVAHAQGDAVAVVVVEPDATNRELLELHKRGARAVRSQMIVAGGMPFDALESIAARIAPLGWHLELYMDTRDLPEMAHRLRSLPVPIVFDHLLLDMLASGRAWVKLANPRSEPSAIRACQLIAANPDQVVWGSDWPHVSWDSAQPPDDGKLLDLLGQWCPDDAARHRILVSNPDRLYFQHH